MNKNALLLSILLLTGGCAVDPLEDRNPVQNTNENINNPEAIRAWLWTYNEQTDSLYVYHTTDKQYWESFQAEIEPDNMPHTAGLIGGGIYPTVWFWNNDKVISFTNGILDHSDHGHIVHPLKHVELPFGNDYNILDMSVAPDGRQIILCGAAGEKLQDSGEIILIDILDGDTTHYSHQEPVSYVVAGNSTILAGNRQSTTAHILRKDNGFTVSYVATDTLVSDGVYHDATGTAFVAGEKKLAVVDMQNASVLKTVEYGESSRITDMLAVSGSNYALGLCDRGGSFCDCFFVIDMKNRVLNRYTISGASLSENIHRGTVVLSNDGSVAVLADLVRPVLYRITLTDGTIEQTAAPDSACPVACNWDGTRVWALAGEKAYQVSFEKNMFVDSIIVPQQTTWIMVTSFRDNNALFDSNDHTF